MQSLSEYISNLLFLHNCVIIPEMGGFISKYNPAIIDNQRGFVFPPSKTIVFNNELTQNDGLLVSFIAHDQKTTYKEAYQWLVDQLNEIKHVLLTDGLVILNELGAFYLDENQKIQFRTDLENNLLSDAFGLQVVRLPMQIRNPVGNKIRDLSNKQTQHPMNNKNKILKAAAIIGPIIAIAAFLPFKNDLFNKKAQKAGVEVATEQQAKADSPQIEEISTQKQQALYYNEKEQVFAYHIIVGSYSSEKNAKIFVGQLTEQGHNAYIVRQNNKFRVSIQKFSDRYEALKKLDFLRNTKNREAWMLKTKEK